MVHLLKNTTDVFLDRVMNKFKEKDYEKIERLFEIYRNYESAVQDVVKDYQNEEKITILKEFQPNIVKNGFFSFS